MENFPLGNSILQVSARDNDKNVRLLYYLSDITNQGSKPNYLYNSPDPWCFIDTANMYYIHYKGIFPVSVLVLF